MLIDELSEDAGESDKPEYRIDKWMMEDNQELTLDALKEKADEVTEKQPEVKVILTPIYAANDIFERVTLETKPTFTLVITGKTLGKEVEIQDLKDIEYGSQPGLEDLTVNEKKVGDDGTIDVDGIGKIICKYVGINGTKYDNTVKPKNAGSYRVVAVPMDENTSVRWSSKPFTIKPRKVTVTGITVRENKEYDGTVNAKLNLTNAVIKHKTEDGKIDEKEDGKIGNDDLVFTANGYFADAAAGTGKNCTIEITLAGKAAGNYTIDNNTCKGSITPKPLTIDDSGLSVAKVKGKNDWNLSGELKLLGVVDNELRLDLSNVKCVSDSTDDTVGENKTVTLKNIELVGSNEKLSNYSLEVKGLEKEENGSYTYIFDRAEIIENRRPELNTHFTVTFPSKPAYNGQSWKADVKTVSGVPGLGEPTVTYARRQDDGSYGTPTETAPVNAGIYKVIVSFTKGEEFEAAQGKNAITAGILFIDKAETATVKASVTMGYAATKTVYLDELDFVDNNAQGVKLKGVKLKELPDPIDQTILEPFTGNVGRSFFTLKAKEVGEEQKADISLTLESDNYKEITLKLTVTVDVYNIVLPTVKLRQFSFYGDKVLKDILELTGGSVTRKGEKVDGTFALKEPNKIYTVGTYTNESIDVVFNTSDEQNLPLMVRASFTIEKEDFSNLDSVYFTIYANSKYNQSETKLVNFVQEKKPTHMAGNSPCDAFWTAVPNGTEFDPKGTLVVNAQGEKVYNWYSYTATLDGSSEKPMAYIRVIPVNAVLSLSNHSKAVKAADITALNNDNDMKTALALPTEAAVIYKSAEDVKEATEIFRQPPDASWNITGWKMDGSDLTLGALKKKADEVTEEQPEVEVTLTPIYSGVPDWATLEDSPVLILVITEKEPVTAEVTVKAPAGITYGDTLGNPQVNGTEAGSDGTVNVDDIGKIICKYVGIDGTKYDSREKPKDVGSYRVIAVLEDEIYSGRWSSGTFTIRPRAVTVTGITVGNKEYDGTTNANAALNTANASISNKVEGDDLAFTAICYFADATAGADKNYMIEITLTGSDAGNYTVSNIMGKGTINKRTLTINDSGLSVTKVLNGSGKLTGEMKLVGVVNNELSLDMRGVTVSNTDNTVGENKTVIFSGIKLVGGDKIKNYSLDATGLKEAGDGTFTYTFNRAEIIEKPRPELGTHFTVAIPAASAYDGQERRAAVETVNGVTGLGEATVTYARKQADGSYGTPTEAAPVNAGTYQVVVSFAAGASFDAAQGKNAITVGNLIINKAASASADANFTIASAAAKTIYLNELGLDNSKAQGVKIKYELNPNLTGSSILESASGTVGRDFFTLKTKAVTQNQTGAFTLALVSDNYEMITVTITITVDAGALNIIPPGVTLKDSSFYGDTALKDVLELTGGSVTLKGKKVDGTFALKEPDKLCTVGTYTNHPIDVVFNSSDGQHKNVPVTVYASFTILPDGDAGDDFSELNVVYLTIYADSKYNKNEGELAKLVKEKKPVHTIEGISYNAAWTADPNNPKFDPKGTLVVNPQGQKAYNWYSYTAALEGSSEKPRVYIRVIPINATLSPADSSATVKAADIKVLNKDNDMKTLLGLPTMVTASYKPAEDVQGATEAFMQTSDTWSITGWKMDGKDLTLDDLKAKADSAASKDVTVTLTSVYSAAFAWATVTNAPTFHLTIKQLEQTGEQKPNGGSGSGSGGGSSGGSGGGGGGGGGGSRGTVSGSNNANGPGGLNSSLPSYVEMGEWTLLNGVWHFVDTAGNMKVNTWTAAYNPYASAGQQNYDWFRFDAYGNMLTGWFLDNDGNWYFLNPISDGTQGMMMTGWVWIMDGFGVQRCYYFNPVSDGYRGKMMTNTIVDGYMIDADGCWTENGIQQIR